MGAQEARDGSRRARSARAFVDVWPSAPPSVYARRPAPVLPFPLEEEQTRLYSTPAEALRHGLQAAGVGAGDELLTPALCDPAMVAAMLALGVVPHFFDADPVRGPVEAELEPLVGPRTRGLYLIHELGFAQPAQRWRAWCDARGLLLVEDASRAWLSSCDSVPTGSVGQVAIFGLRETYGVGVGAALLAETAPTPLADGGLAARRRAFLLPRLAADDAAAGRRQSWAALASELSDQLADGFDALPAGAAPFCFPVRAPDKRRLIERCAARGVRAIDAWAAPHPAATDGFPAAAERRATTAGLPVHQALDIGDLDRVIDAAAERPVRPAPLRLEPVERLEDVRDEFDRLAEEARNLFATWDWIEAWWRHYGAGRTLATYAARDAAGRTVGLVPAYRSAAGPVAMLRFIGHGPFDWLGPVCAPQDVPAVARALARGLRSGMLGADLLLGEQMAGEQRWGALLGGSVVVRDSSPILSFDGDFEAWLASRSRNFRDQVRRRERKLARTHELSYRLCASEDELDRDLDTLFRLHTARWGQVGTSFAADDHAFHRDIALAALRRGLLRLWTMELDGRPAAAWLGYRFAGAEWYYQAGRDPELEPLSVGFVMLAHTIRAALDDGVGEYRLLRGGEEYKSRFANGDPGLETVVAAGSGSGRLAAAAATAAAAAPPRARQWLRSVAA